MSTYSLWLRVSLLLRILLQLIAGELVYTAARFGFDHALKRDVEEAVMTME